MTGWPPVECVCPTYGRFSLLKESLAFFLAQDYPGEKRLMILNEGPRRLRLGGRTPPEVLSLHSRASFPTLGHKRQFLLEAAEAPIVAHWDDDDIYLPEHLSRSVRFLLDEDLDCTKASRVWIMEGGRVTRRWSQGNDATMVFRHTPALLLGGYGRRQVGQSITLLHAFQRAGRYRHLPPRVRTFVRRRLPKAHNAALSDAETFRRLNTDLPSGEPLEPADVSALMAAIRDDINTLEGR